jgi:hypothetical protein
LGSAIPALWRATQAPSGKGSISFSFGNGVFSLTVSVNGSEIWAGSMSVLALALWIAIPPLLLWFAWLSQRPSVRESARTVR